MTREWSIMNSNVTIDCIKSTTQCLRSRSLFQIWRHSALVQKALQSLAPWNFSFHLGSRRINNHIPIRGPLWIILNPLEVPLDSSKYSFSRSTKIPKRASRTTSPSNTSSGPSWSKASMSDSCAVAAWCDAVTNEPGEQPGFGASCGSGASKTGGLSREPREGRILGEPERNETKERSSKERKKPKKPM